MSERTRTGAAGKLSAAERSATHNALLDATEALIRDEGAAAVTARRVTQKAGLKNHQIIYYYFATNEDLLRAVLRRRSDRHLEALQRVMQADNILRALWDHYRSPTESLFGMEFMALAQRYEDIRAEIASYGAKFRELEMAAVSRHFAERGLSSPAHPAVISLAMASLSRVMAREATLGLHIGHDEVDAVVEAYLRDIEEQAPPRTRGGASTS